MNTIDKVLIGVVTFLIAFTVSMIIVFCFFQSTPDTLIECVFGCAGGEAVITFAIWWIKKKSSGRVKNGTDKKEVSKP